MQYFIPLNSVRWNVNPCLRGFVKVLLSGSRRNLKSMSFCVECNLDLAGIPNDHFLFLEMCVN